MTGKQFKSMDEHADAVARVMFTSNADAALQAVIELMLTSQPARNVVDKLRAWADYLDERR